MFINSALFDIAMFADKRIVAATIHSDSPLEKERRKSRRPWLRGRRRRDRRGQSLIEFGLVALVLYILMAFVLDFGRGIHGAQVIQSAADLAARELSRTPLPASTETFIQAMTNEPAFQAVYSENFLAVDISGQPAGEDLLTYLDSLGMPPVNKALVPLMFVSQVGGSSILRYPGALVTNPSSSAQSPYTVMVPVLTGGTSAGVGPETIAWHRVLEPILPSGVTADNATTSTDPFSVLAPAGAGIPGGVIAVRINYPFQAAAMTGFQPPQNDANGEALPNAGFPMSADDAGVTATNDVPNGGSPVAPDEIAGQYSGTYGGSYGLGEQGALGTTVRPFRRVISAQAIYRREIFSN